MEVMSTFVQISDLHLSATAPQPADLQAYRSWPFLDGFLGHDHRALAQVERFFRGLQKREQARLITTGDLTQLGSSAQLTVAAEVLGAHAPAFNGLGLAQSDWHDRGIPGNHDQWGGNHIFGGPAPQVGAVFGPLPRETLVHAGNRTIRILLLDTDADVHSGGMERLLAWGSFRSQLASLDAHLKQIPRGEELRVLLMHHAPSHAGSTLRVSPTSQRALRHFLSRHQVSVVLCGHVHSSNTLRLRCPRRWTAWEICCGTSAQRTVLPARWRAALGPSTTARRIAVNEVLVHRLVVTDRFAWAVECFRIGAVGKPKKQWGRLLPLA